MRAGVGVVCAGVLLVACGSTAKPGATPSPSPYVATPTPVPTPTLTPHDLAQLYIVTLTRDLNALPHVSAACSGTIAGCATALDEQETVANQALTDLQHLSAEPAAITQVVEDIRYNLRFFHGWGPLVRTGQHSVQEAVTFSEGDRSHLLDDLAKLKAEAP